MRKLQKLSIGSDLKSRLQTKSHFADLLCNGSIQIFKKNTLCPDFILKSLIPD